MTGVFANPLAIIAGALAGILLGKIIPDRVSKRIELALGLCIVILGLKMALKFENALMLVLCVAGGGVAGTLLDLDQRIEAWSKRVQKRLQGNVKDREGKFVHGFVTASVLFCTGAMAVVGAIDSGARGNHEILFAKSVLDGVISITFASVYGFGVAFSALPVLLYQGAIALLASQLESLTSPHVLNELSGVGGLLLAMVGINLTGIHRIAVVDFLPAIPVVLVAASFL